MPRDTGAKKLALGRFLSGTGETLSGYSKMLRDEPERKLRLGRLRQETSAGDIALQEKERQMQQAAEGRTKLGEFGTFAGTKSLNDVNMLPTTEEKRAKASELRLSEFAPYEPAVESTLSDLEREEGAEIQKEKLATAQDTAREKKLLKQIEDAEDARQKSFDNDLKVRSLEARETRNEQLHDERLLGIKQAAKQHFQTNMKVRAMADANRFLQIAREAIDKDDIASDQFLVKSVEKLVQDGAVLQGEADAYSNAGKTLGRVDENGVWRALVDKSTGRIPPSIRKSMADFAEKIYRKRLETFREFRNGQVELYSGPNFGFPKEEVEQLFGDIKEVSPLAKESKVGKYSGTVEEVE